MPRTRSLAAYPAEYAEIVRKVAISGDSLLVPVPSALQARKLRGQFYAWVGALKSAAERVRNSQAKSPNLLLSSEQAEILELEAFVGQIVAQAEETGLRFLPRSESWQAQTLRAALGKSAELLPSPEFMRKLKGD